MTTCEGRDFWFGYNSPPGEPTTTAIGLTLMLGWGLWEFGTEFLTDSEVPLVLRLGVGTFVGGLLLLTVNFLRERLYRRKTERYDEVVR